MKAQPGTLRASLQERTTIGTLGINETNASGKKGIRCFACGHRCFIPEGLEGVCKVRYNKAGELRVPWGYVGGIHVDPIEKKPFFHVLPGSLALSFGMLGCDLHCAYCQNWVTSQSLRDSNAQSHPYDMRATNLVAKAMQSNARIIASTYNEPLITAEWAVEIFSEAKKRNLLCAFVSNGNATPEVLQFIRPYVDLYKVDLKSFQDKHYRELGGVLANVLSSIETIHRMGFYLEIVTLLIPDFNDSPEEIKELTSFIAGVSRDIPWHVTAFHPDYKMQGPRATTPEDLLRAAEQGKNAGLRYVYAGNLPGKVGEWENTRCSQCEKTLIERHGFMVIGMELENGKCPDCDHPLPGVW